jgi:hypothetical protein
MLVTTTETKAVITRTVEIKGGPVIRPGGYKRRFRVDTVTIKYHWKDGAFVAADQHDFSLSGPWIKNDGSDAKDRADGKRPDYVHWRTRAWKPEYDFLVTLRDLLNPHADLSMMVMNEAKVG